MLVDARGAVTDNYLPSAWLRAGMDTFGRYVSGSGTTVNPYRYGAAWGYITDPSGLLQLGARFYWPEVGRFVQRDPAKDGTNWYAYVRNQPTVGIDPCGRKKCSAWVPDPQPVMKGPYKTTIETRCKQVGDELDVDAGRCSCIYECQRWEKDWYHDELRQMRTCEECGKKWTEHREIPLPDYWMWGDPVGRPWQVKKPGIILTGPQGAFWCFCGQP